MYHLLFKSNYAQIYLCKLLNKLLLKMNNVIIKNQ